MKKIIAIFISLCSLISLCSCGESINNERQQKYQKLIDALENKEIYTAHDELFKLTENFNGKGISYYYNNRGNAYEEPEEDEKNVTKIKINKDNLFDYFEVINQERFTVNEFNDIETVYVDTYLRLKQGYYLADYSKFRTSIEASFSATKVIKTYYLDKESGLFSLGNYAPNNDKYKANESLEATICSESTLLGQTNYWGASDFGPDLGMYINIKPTTANGTLYLIDEPKEDTNSKKEYQALIEALKERDFSTAHKEFFELTKEARNKNAQKELEEYKKQVTEIEINSDNLLNYFEFVNLKEFEYNDFNEVESIYIKTVLRLKKEFTLADTTKLNTNISASVGVTETTRIFHFDKKSNTFTLKGYAPRSQMNVHLRDFDIAITESSTDVFLPYSAMVNSDRYIIQLGEDGRVFSASGKLYLVNNEVQK